MDKLYNWVNANPPSPDRKFSGSRALRLFVVIMLCAVLGSLPIALVKLGLFFNSEAQTEQDHQDKLKQGWNDLDKAVRDGEAGEATNRLFGKEAPGSGVQKAPGDQPRKTPDKH